MLIVPVAGKFLMESIRETPLLAMRQGIYPSPLKYWKKFLIWVTKAAMKFRYIDDKRKDELEQRHRGERDGRVRDRIKAVLLKSEGWKDRAIAQALRIHEETVRQHLADWESEENTNLKTVGRVASSMMRNHAHL